MERGVVPVVSERDGASVVMGGQHGGTLDAPDANHALMTIPADSTRELTAELRGLVSVRSRSSLRDRHLPVLWSHLDTEVRDPPDRRLVALMKLLDASITDMADPAHREAAQALLGSGANRWDSLKVRGNQAASKFGCGWDAYRRRRPSVGTSQLDDTIEALAEAIIGRAGVGPVVEAAPPVVRISGASPKSVVEAAPSEPTPAGDVDGLELDPPLPLSPHEGATRRWSEVLLVAVAIAGVLAVAGVAVVRIRGDNQPVSTMGASDVDRPVECGTLNNKPGEFASTADVSVRALSDDFVAAAARADRPIVCAGLMELLDEAVAQPIARGDRSGTGALVAAADPTAVRGDGPTVLFLHHGEYGHLRRALDRGSREGLGAPVERRDTDTHHVVEFTRGLLVSERTGSPTYALTGKVWEEWQEKGGLDGEVGPPVQARREVAGVGRLFDFARGHAVVDYVTGDVRWEYITNPSDQLPSDYIGSVLISTGGASWLVDLDGVRHWIPDTTAYACATGSQAAPPVRAVPAAAIASLEPGEAFRCR